MKNTMAAVFFIFLMAVSAQTALSEVPFVLKNGDIIDATELNSNFDFIENELELAKSELNSNLSSIEGEVEILRNDFDSVESNVEILRNDFDVTKTELNSNFSLIQSEVGILRYDLEIVKSDLAALPYYVEENFPVVRSAGNEIGKLIDVSSLKMTVRLKNGLCDMIINPDGSMDSCNQNENPGHDTNIYYTTTYCTGSSQYYKLASYSTSYFPILPKGGALINYAGNLYFFEKQPVVYIGIVKSWYNTQQKYCNMLENNEVKSLLIKLKPNDPAITGISKLPLDRPITVDGYTESSYQKIY